MGQSLRISCQRHVETAQVQRRRSASPNPRRLGRVAATWRRPASCSGAAGGLLRWTPGHGQHPPPAAQSGFPLSSPQSRPAAGQLSHRETICVVLIMPGLQTTQEKQISDAWGYALQNPDELQRTICRVLMMPGLGLCCLPMIGAHLALTHLAESGRCPTAGRPATG